MKSKRSDAGDETPAAKRHGDTLWQLYCLAFSSLIRPYRRSSASRYDECGEFESAQDVAHLAMMLAVAASAKWEAHARRNSTPGRPRGRSRKLIADEEALPDKKEAEAA
jgi:hypothetical protein